jgi:hypothetical protein
MKIPALLLCLLPACLLQAQDLPAKEIKHRFLAVDNGANHLIHVDQVHPEKNWSVTVPAGSRDLQLVRPGIVLLSYGAGAAEYRLSDGQPDGWKAEGFKDIQTAWRLADGSTLLGTGAGVIITVDAKGVETGRFSIQQPKLNMRLLRPTPAGTLLIGGCAPEFAVLEVERPGGKVLRKLPLPQKGYKAMALANGNILASAGGTVNVLEFDAAGKTVSTVGGKAAFPKLGFDFFSGFERLANGNVVVANWLGHGKQGTGPHLVELTPANQLVWSWADHQAAKQVTNLLILDDSVPQNQPK